MASLLDRMNMAPSVGPVRSKSSSSRPSTPYARRETPKGDIDSQWSHDLYEAHNSLSARLGVDDPTALKPGRFNSLAQRALRDATGNDGLSIRGASGKTFNRVEVSGLMPGTTAADVETIFKRCGQITEAVIASEDPASVTIRLTFKDASSADAAVKKFDKQQADGRVLNVRAVGQTAAKSLAGRLGGSDGLDLVRGEGSVDVLMQSNDDSGSKMRSDSLLKTAGASIMVAPPGANPAEYMPSSQGGGRARGRGRGAGGGFRGGRGSRRGRGSLGARMDLD